MDVAMTFQYQIITDKVTDIATVYGSLDALQARIQSIVIEQTKSVLSSYKAMDIIANRASISPAVEQAIIDAVTDEYYVNIVTVALTNIDFSDAFEQAVEDKMIAEQAKLKADYENQTKVAKAEADAAAKLAAAQAEIEIAKAEAEAKKIAAEAEAEANRIVADSLTDIILEKIYAENWNGELPDVVGSGDYILPSDIFQTEK
jgi:regulator of protease activity HflC (stomatin/prohibitin superfamily)